MRKNNLTLAVLFLMLLTDICESAAQALMKMGLNKTGIDNVTFANLTEFVVKGATSGYIWLGILIFLINFFMWITVLSRIDLSIAYPVSSFSYILVPILAMISLHEVVNPLRWVGIVLIIAGVYLVAKSAEMKTMPL